MITKLGFDLRSGVCYEATYSSSRDYVETAIRANHFRDQLESFQHKMKLSLAACDNNAKYLITQYNGKGSIAQMLLSV